MAWTQQGYQFFNPDTGQYYIPQVMGGSGPTAFGVGSGLEGTIGVPSGDPTAAPQGFDYWGAQGRSSPNTGFVQGTSMPASGTQPGMPTGQGWLSSNPFGSANFSNKDGGPLSQLQGLAIPGAFLGAGALGGGLGLGGASGVSGAAGAVPSGGGMDWLDSLTNLFSGGGDMSNVLWDQVPGGVGTAVTGGAGNATFGINDLMGSAVGSGATIPATGWQSLFGGSSGLPGGIGSGLSSLLGGGSGVGGALGALAGGIGANNKPAGNITTTTDIPDYLKPYQSMNLGNASNNFSTAASGNALIPGGINFLQGQINGQYLNPQTNPAFNAYANDLAGIAGSQYLSTFGHVGAAPDNLNNSNTAEGFGRGVTAAMLPLANSAMQTGLQNQYNAAANAPGYAGNVANATFSPNIAFKNLYSGPTANTQPYFTNTAGGILSGALAGSTIGKSLFGA